MANVISPTYSFTLPEVGADVNAWGGHLNGNFTIIDNNMLSRIKTASQSMAGAITLPANGLNVGSGQLNVTGGNVSVSGGLSVGGSVGVSGALGTGDTTIVGFCSIAGTLGVGQAATFSNTLGVTGAATFSSTATAAFTPSLGSHLTNKTYVDAQVATRLPLSGGTMSGNIVIQNTTPQITLSDTDGSTVYVRCDGGLAGILNSAQTTWLHYVDQSGNFTAAGNVTAYSDARLKENVRTVQDALSLVARMRGVFYDRIDTGEHGVGVIAQEMQEVLPQVVHENDGKLSVAYGNVVGVLIEAVKELSARIEQLEGK